MSDFLYIKIAGAANEMISDDQAVSFVKETCKKDIPHNLLSHFRVNITVRDDNISVEPFFGSVSFATLPRKKLPFVKMAMRALVEWAKAKSSEVFIVREGLRKNRRLPPMEIRTGTIDDAIQYGEKKEHYVLFSLIEEST